MSLSHNYMESMAELYLSSAEDRFVILVSSSATQFLSSLLQHYLVISQWNFVGMYSRMIISKCNHWNILLTTSPPFSHSPFFFFLTVIGFIIDYKPLKCKLCVSLQSA